MLKVIEKTAKNVNEAVEAAAKELGVSVEEVGYEVIRESNKGLMKLLLGSEVEISAWVKAEKEKLDKKSAPKAKKEETAKPKKEMPKKAVKAEKKEENEAQAKPEKVEKAEKPEKPEKPAKKVLDEEVVISKETIDDAKYFLSELLNKIGLKHDIHVKLDRNEIKMVITGDKMGLLIGNHGKTLDSIQFLTNLYVNRHKKTYIKVSIDTENYRKKREEALINLARSLSKTVLKTNKPVTLEPMNANQRRIIHMALQNNSKVKTYSVGEEPRRKVVVAPVETNKEEKSE